MKIDIGCGPITNKQFGFIGIDNDITNTPDILCEATCLQINNDSCEEVYSRRCLQHIANENKALQEIYRVLKPNGKLTLIVAGWLPWVYYHLGLSSSSGKYQILHFYTKKRLQSKLTENGFKILEIKKLPSNHFKLAYDIQVIAIKEPLSC